MTSAELPQVNVNAHKDKSSRDLQAKDVLGDGDVLTAHDLKTKRAVSLGQTLEKVGGVQKRRFRPQHRSASNPQLERFARLYQRKRHGCVRYGRNQRQSADHGQPVFSR